VDLVKAKGFKPSESKFLAKVFLSNLISLTYNILYKYKIYTKLFSRISYLCCRIITHTIQKPYIYEICGKQFFFNTKLQCQFCDSSFTPSCHLSYHLRVHTPEKPYIYIIYSRQFFSKIYIVQSIETPY